MSVNATKSPDEQLDFGFLWTNWLQGSEVIATSEWEILPAGLTVVDEQTTDTATAIWVSGGVLGTVYTMTNTITTNSDPERVIQQSIELYVRAA